MSKNKNEFKNPMHPRNKKILISGGIAAVLCVAFGIGLSVYNRNNLPAPLPVQTPASSSTVSSTSLDPSLYDYKPQIPESSVSSGTNDKVTQNVDSEGNTSIDKETGKPDAPKPPQLPEGTDTTNPDSKPDYNPEDTNPNNPQPGDKNDKGETWLPGIGWVGKGSGGTGEIADFDLTGEQVGH